MKRPPITTPTDAAYYDGVVGNWLFDDARKERRHRRSWKLATNYYVGLFHSRGREEYNTVDVRHILIHARDRHQGSRATRAMMTSRTQLKAAARTKAEEILAEWKAGEATEDSFAQLAMEDSADGSKYDRRSLHPCHQGLGRGGVQ